MKTTIRILLAVAFLGIVGIATFVFLRQKNDVVSTPPGTNTTFPISGQNTDGGEQNDGPDEGSSGETGEETPPTTEDFIDLGGGSYIVSGGNSLTEIPEYQIIYYEPDGSYAISLQSFPLSYTRKRAEPELMAMLNLSEAQMCSRKIMVTVPFDVDERYSGRNLLLSFCPGAVALP